MISEQGTGLLGFATSRKIGSQPRRNLAKRIFREAYNLNRGSDTPLLDLVVVIQPSSQEASFVQIKEELRVLMEKTVLRWEKRSESS